MNRDGQIESMKRYSQFKFIQLMKFPSLKHGFSSHLVLKGGGEAVVEHFLVENWRDTS